MELRHRRCFAAVVEHLTVTVAADSLGFVIDTALMRSRPGLAVRPA